MIIKESADNNPYRNLAREEYLCRTQSEGALFLWQNAPTVVIGKHQDAFAECDLMAMARDGVLLARRKTGGGAVFHDENNVNFSIISAVDQREKNFELLIKAFAGLGIETSLSGRNDLLCRGRKFSGSAFLSTKDYFLHHGTVMVNVDKERMSRYLNVKDAKLAKNGVKSVKSRVINLSEVADVTAEDVKKAVKTAFSAAYSISPDPAEDSEIAALEREYSSEEFIYGRFTRKIGTVQTAFGELTVAMDGDDYKVFSDCHDEFIVAAAERILSGGEPENDKEIEIANMLRRIIKE